MTVYVIAQLRFTNTELYRRYESRFPNVFKRFNGRVLTADEHPQILEGSWDRNKVVIMSFPDEAEARRFVTDPEYREISKDREAGADTVSLLVRGLGQAPPPSS